MRGRKVDDDRFAEMWRRGEPVGAIRDAFGLGATNSVYLAAKRLGLPLSVRGSVRMPPASPAPVAQPVTLAAAVALHGGTWAGRQAVAERFGVSPVKVLQEWHRLRVRG